MSVKLNSSGGGSVTLQEPSTASNRTLTLPDNTGTVVSTASTGVISQAMLASGVAGNGPAFSVYGSALQSVTNATYTKVSYNTKEFDTNTNYDTTTFRFTPTVSGYYQINAIVTFNNTATAAARGIVAIYKNGSAVRLVSGNLNSASATNLLTSSVISMNGSTDYIEIFMYQDSGGALNCGSQATSVTCTGCLVRAA